MACPRCGSGAPAVNGRCPVCSTVDFDGPTIAPGTRAPLGSEVSHAGGGDAPRSSGPSTAAAASAQTPAPAEPPRTSTGMGPVGPLRVGENFGTRYHLIKLLGLGGMGAVYQAWDQVLEVAVALKVIRPDATDDPSMAEELSRRFKRELLLARQITHKNVVRIHDLGEVDGTQYISMPYVHGSDLASVLKREGRLSVERAIAIAKEVASGLAAAHDAGVIHRDLKPANIMIDTEGSALIMDFGIARSTSATGFGSTAAGIVVGTVDYMAPEQARGESVDQRADIYSFGLILNDSLLGRRQGGASGVTELLARMGQAPASMRSIDPTIPAGIDAVVTKCVQVDPAARYQTLRELLADLDALDRTGNAAHKLPSAPPVTARRVPWWAWAVAAVALLALGGTGWVLRDRLGLVQQQTVAVSGPPISLAILPFRNASGDQSLDSLGASVSEVLRTELGQSSRVRTVPSDRLRQVLTDLRISSAATLAPAELARVAEFTSARSVVWGQITRFGNAIRVDATLQDLDRDETVPLNAMAPNESALLAAISQLASTVQQQLARGSADVLNELKSTAWKPSTASFEALRLYNEAQQLRQQGNYQDALKKFEAATRADENFALAFSGLASTYATLGYDSEAGQFSRRAVSLSDALPAQEKYLISATHFQVLRDTKRATEAYENLAKASPNNVMVQFELGGLYEASGEYERAKQSFEKVVQLDPKFSEGLLALGRVKIRGGHPQESLEQLNAALTLAIQFNNDESRANILQAIGIAYKLMGRPQEALRRYEESLDIKRRIGNRRGMAASLTEIAQIHETLGEIKQAEQGFRDAVALRRNIGDKSGLAESITSLAHVLNEGAGRPDEALPLLREALQLRRDAGDQHGEALVLNNIGTVYLAKGEYSEAQTYFERALESREKSKIPGELADTLHNLGETLSKMGRYDQSLAQYVRALELRRSADDRRGAAIESYSIGTIFDYQGRYGAAVKSKEEALAAFRDLQQRDVWLGEILSGYGDSLALSGRMDDAKKQLDEAMGVANELKNPMLVAQTSRFAADRMMYMGDVKGAARQADEALRAASRASDKSMMLLAQAASAIAAAGVQPPSRALAAQFATIARDGDALGLQFLSVDSAIRRAELLLKMGDRAGARQEIDRALARAETLSLRRLLAQAHFVRGEVLRAASDAEARRDYASALRLLDEMKAEEGSQDLLKRADVAAMYEQSARFAKQ